MSDQKPSIDPRVNRIELPENKNQFQEEKLLQWQTYEVFQQQERGMQHIHVGSLHAPNPEMALVLAKEQYGRREQCANLWVVKSSDVHATAYEDADMFQHALDKSYRESEGYRVKDTIETFKKDLDRLLGHDQPAVSGSSISHQTFIPAVSSSSPAPSGQGWKVYDLSEPGQKVRKILVRHNH